MNVHVLLKERRLYVCGCHVSKHQSVGVKAYLGACLSVLRSDPGRKNTPGAVYEWKGMRGRDDITVVEVSSAVKATL